MPTRPPAKKPVKTPEQKKATLAAQGIKERIKEKPPSEAYDPSSTERTVITYMKRRIDEMRDFRKGLGIEQRWKEADEEYVPHELDFGTTRKRFETDQDTGLRSRMVPVGDVTQQWRQASSAPTLLAKIQTAISIIIDQQPEGELVALGKKFVATTDLVYAAWKRNWQITNAKEKLKVFVFDLIKYGWAAQRTYPRKVEYDKRVLVETDLENPENDKYEDRKLMWFNDIDRQNLSVFQTWVDELARPYDPYSINEEYFELDFSYDAAKVEFGKYPNFKYVKPDSQMVRTDDQKKSNRQSEGVSNLKRKDVVTVGFFESRHKDLYGIWIPKDSIMLYVGPLPNDDGLLQIVQSMWIMRRSNLPYGVSLWEIIRQNKALYDKMKNMTMDQLVLSIMKFGFHTGTTQNIGDGMMQIVPGQSRQVTVASGKASDAFSWMEMPGPGQDAWKGLEAVASMMDDESGISPTLEGEVTGKTLGEILHAKDAALKRLKVPVENIAWAIEQDAYLTISWMPQLYSIPMLKEFESEDAMLAFEKEEQIEHSGPIFGTNVPDEENPGQTKLTGPFKAQYYPQLAMHLEDDEGQLKEGKESKYFQLGENKDKGQILPGALKWRGIFKVIPRSIIDTSQDLTKAMKMEVFNLISPMLQFPPELVAKPLAQVLKINEEDPADWLPQAMLDYLKNGSLPPAPALPGAGPEAGPGMPSAGGNTIQSDAGLTPPQSATVVPGSPMPSIAQLMGGKAGGYNKRL